MIFESNINALQKIYPNIAKLLCEPLEKTPYIPSQQQQKELVKNQLKTCWSPNVELHIIYRFSTSNLAFELFKKIQLEELTTNLNRRMILIEDQPENALHAMKEKNWTALINSERCLFVIDHASKQSFKRLIERYPDIAFASHQFYSGMPGSAENVVTDLSQWLNSLKKNIGAKRFKIPMPDSTPPYPKTIRFLMPGHNIFQDSCVNAFQNMGYNAQRLQWKSPLYRFVRSTAWLQEYAQSQFDIALLINSTPKIFSPNLKFDAFQFQRISWFLDNPRRFAFLPEHFKGCDLIALFDFVYKDDLQSKTNAKIIELKTGYGIKEPKQKNNDFENIDIAFVGELGPKGFLPVECLFNEKNPDIVKLVNEFLYTQNIIDPNYLLPPADAYFSQYNIPYRGALVELLENKATTIRRRHFLEALTQFDLKIFGDEDWNNPKFAGPLTNHWAGKRLDYQTELPHLYANAKININIFHNQCVTAPNPRVYDVLACGGFLLTSANQSINEEFEPGKDLVIFHSPEELVELTKYYLNHEQKRLAIAKAGQTKVLAKYSYQDRLQTLLHELS